MEIQYAVSIIIVNWNSRMYLRNCIKSIYETCQNIQVEIIIVDNASYDGSIEMCKNEFPDVKTIQLSSNKGFAAANNAATEEATAPLILFLNPDTILLKGAVSELINSFTIEDKIGIVGARLFNKDGSLQTSCVLPFPGILRQIFEYEKLIRKTHKWKFWGISGLYENSGPVAVEAVSGACIMIRRDDFHLVNKFSSNYFMYAEDVDLCYKVQKIGKKVYHIPDAKVIHFGGGATSKNTISFFPEILMISARYLFFKKYFGHIKAYLFRMSITIISLVRMFIAYNQVRLFNLDTSYTLQKWNALFSWSVGLEKWAENTHKNLYLDR
jgi:GT2 family glycosyltransferase